MPCQAASDSNLPVGSNIFEIFRSYLPVNSVAAAARDGGQSSANDNTVYVLTRIQTLHTEQFMQAVFLLYNLKILKSKILKS